METTSNKNKVKGNDEADVHNDEIGENTGDDTEIAKAAKLKADANDISKTASSNKGQGPSGENL